MYTRRGDILSANHLVLVVAERKRQEVGVDAGVPAPVPETATKAEQEVQRGLVADAVVRASSCFPAKTRDGS
jgi:hypothetical protein